MDSNFWNKLINQPWIHLYMIVAFSRHPPTMKIEKLEQEVITLASLPSKHLVKSREMKLGLQRCF
jgi:hypothetical protein